MRVCPLFLKDGGLHPPQLLTLVPISFLFSSSLRVVQWLVNVAVSEMILMRMRICGQLANIINPIDT